MAAANVAGNVYDKYGTRNPIARRLMDGFLDAVTALYAQTGARSVLEVGCGEGRLAMHLLGSCPRPDRFVATDLDLGVLDPGLDPLIETRRASVYELPFEDGAFDLVVGCEVLEHLEEPGRGLAEMTRVARKHVLVSTPREPLWRVMNMVRLRYVRDLGNTPGHVQHFSRAALERLVAGHLRILETRAPLPWTVILGEPRRQPGT